MKPPHKAAYGQVKRYHRRFDDYHAIDCVLSWGDLGFIDSTAIEESIVFNKPWLNPLKWITVWVSSVPGNPGKQEAIAMLSQIYKTGYLPGGRQVHVVTQQSSIVPQMAGVSG